MATEAYAQQFLDQTATRFPPPLSEYSNQATLGDIDNDMDLDIIFANANGFGCPSPQTIRLYINDGAGFFTDESAGRVGLAARARGIELGDVDRDGDLDMVVAQECNQRGLLLINDGTGNFTDETTTRMPTTTMSSSRAQFLDIDDDNDLDLFFCNGGGSRFNTGPSKVFENDGNGFFTDISATAFVGSANVGQPMDVSVADVDSDLDVDVIAGGRGNGGSRLFINDGTGVFSLGTFPSDFSTYSYDFGDADGDGDLDLLGANAAAGNGEWLLKNNGAGIFTGTQVLPTSSSDDNDTKFIDYDNDGDLDAFVARIGGPERAYQNDGNGVYTLVGGILPSVSTSSLDIMVGDLDNDGDYDVVMANGESGNFINRVYINTGPEDTRPPRILRIDDPGDTEDTVGPYIIKAQIVDDMSSDRNFFDHGIVIDYTVVTPGPGPGIGGQVDMDHVGGQIYRGEIPGQPEGSSIEYVISATDWNDNTVMSSLLSFDIEGPPQCLDLADCADIDDDGIRDDNCVWQSCDDGMCANIAIVFADMGGQFGACAPDGAADGNDRFQALNCFADVDVDQEPGYPCELDPPNALNVDAGGKFGDCNPDGVCDGNDAFAALNAFAGTSACSCPLDGDPAPTIDLAPVVTAKSALHLTAPSRVRAGELVEVDVFLSTPLDDLRGYQLHLATGGGTHGTLELVDVAIADEAVLDSAWSAFNIVSGQMVAGTDVPGRRVEAGYLATFTYRASSDARGTFTVDVLHGADRDTRTYLFPTPAQGMIAIADTAPLQIEVTGPRSRNRK